MDKIKYKLARICLLKYVLTIVPLIHMSFFKMYFSVVKRIKKVQSDFPWVRRGKERE